MPTERPLNGPPVLTATEKIIHLFTADADMALFATSHHMGDVFGLEYPVASGGALNDCKISQLGTAAALSTKNKRAPSPRVH